MQGKRVLIVAENTTSRMVLGEYIQATGGNPVGITADTAALHNLHTAIADRQPFQAVVIDRRVTGPKESDLAAVLAADPDLRTIPIILFVSPTDKGSAVTTANEGYLRALVKPIQPTVLVDSLSTMLSGKPALAATVQKPQTAAANFTDRDVRILVAEDNIVNQKVILGLLKKLGLKADTVANGQETIDALGQIPYDIVLMDCQMPIMDGYEATKLIRTMTSPVLDHAIPIIALTANAMKGDREKCLLAGMDDYLAKPIKPKGLVAALEKWMPVKISSPA